MQIDTYTKVVLTVIAIGVGLLVFDQKPVKDAQAANVSGNYILSTAGNNVGVWQMADVRIRFCRADRRSPPSHECTSWQR